VSDFAAFAADKARDAASAYISRLNTLDDRSAAFGCVQVGNGWTHEHYDGLFLLPAHARGEVPCVSLCFVQSRDGNTGAADPDILGGGPTDKHLIYEGLSRVAADGVMAGAATAEGEKTFFSVWHPELVALRAALGLPRHPAQIVLTARGCVDLDRTLLFNVPDVPVYIIAAPAACERLEMALSRHTGVELVPMTADDLRTPLAYLRQKRSISRISCIGGRSTATALLDSGVVQDLCLTTTERSAGEPGTPFYTGTKKPLLDLMVRKRADDPDYPIVFEHFSVTGSSPRSDPTPRR
jgi:riboflavin biosynthesis pyrimidine reductase